MSQENAPNLEQVRNEIRESVEKRLNEGKSLEVIRKEILESLIYTYQYTEMKLVMEIMFDPNAGASFAYNVHKTVVATNEVLSGEYGMEEVDIHDFKLATVKTIEQVTGQDIYVTIDKIEKAQQELH